MTTFAAAAAPAAAKLCYAPTPFSDLTKSSDLALVTTGVERQKQKLAALKQAIEENEEILNRNFEHQGILETVKKNADALAKRELEAKEAKRLKRESDEKAKEEEHEKERKKAKILERIQRDQAALIALETPSTAAGSNVPSPNLSESAKNKGTNAGKEYLCGQCKKPIKDHTTEQRRECLDKRKKQIDEKQQDKEGKKAEKPMKVEKPKGIQKPKSPRRGLAIKIRVPKKSRIPLDNNAARLVEMQEEGSSMPHPLPGPGKGKGPGGLKPEADPDVTNLVSGSESSPESGSDLSSEPGSPSGSEQDLDDSQ